MKTLEKIVYVATGSTLVPNMAKAIDHYMPSPNFSGSTEPSLWLMVPPLIMGAGLLYSIYNKTKN